MSRETGRVGQLDCACPAGMTQTAISDNRATLAVGFGLAVLSQALVLAVLPEESRLMAPNPDLVGLPFALLLIGAAIAGFPAVLLLDSFGRRAAFGLGASLGAAGGALCAFATTRYNFAALCLGAFWLGLAQGFALFYRHSAAQGAARGALAVFGGGALAAFVAPAALATTTSPATIFAAAAALHIGGLALAVRQPHARPPAQPAPRREAASTRDSRTSLHATLIAALAWFVMAAAMLHGPLSLAACAATPAFIGGATGWHLLAMYAPAALAARWPMFFPPVGGGLGALALMLVGMAAIYAAATPALIASGLFAVGAGWSLANVASLRLLHDRTHLSRQALAAHDFTVLVAAAAGALAF